MRPHENLKVWKKSIDFVTEIYRVTKNFPADEKYGLTSQIRRAAVSIPANIAEGSAHRSDKGFLQFPSVAQGSSSELETELLISLNLNYLNGKEYSDLKTETDDIGKMLIGLSNHIRKKQKKQ